MQKLISRQVLLKDEAAVIAQECCLMADTLFDSFVVFKRIINQKLNALDMELKAVRCTMTGAAMIVLINSSQNETLKFASSFKQSEVAYFRDIVILQLNRLN
jgi:hypothetical protein